MTKNNNGRKPLWLLKNGRIVMFTHGDALAQELGTTVNCVFSAFSKRKHKLMPARWKGYTFWNYDPAYKGAYNLKNKEHKAGEPLLVGNPTHHIGVWR